MKNELSPLEKTVIDNIRRIRREKGISQERLSVFCDTSVSYIGLMETYKNIPKLSTIERIATALNVPVQSLFVDKKNSISKNEATKKEKLRKKIKEEILSEFSERLDSILSII